MWGYRTDWINFAPDFQALQQNVLYEEKEDEFDIVVDGDGQEVKDGTCSSDSLQNEDVDIITKMDGCRDNFFFSTRVLKMIPDKPSKKIEHD